ncbi:hypothetical protein J6590_065947 [Homalodisca vitripennis]|nr:hypothetical protein J6590_065947 [Homalodisca vitripennis]
MTLRGADERTDIAILVSIPMTTKLWSPNPPVAFSERLEYNPLGAFTAWTGYRCYEGSMNMGTVSVTL